TRQRTSTHTARRIWSTSACAQASASMDSGSGHPTTRAARPDPTTRWSKSSPPSFRSARRRRLPFRAPERTARVRVLIRQRRHPSRGHRDIHGPAHAEHPLAEDLIGVRIPVGIAETLERRQAKVVGHDTRDLAMPGSLRVGLLELLIERAEEREPDSSSQKAVKVFHLETTAGAGVVPGCTAGTPFAQSGHSVAEYEGMSSRQRALTGTSRRAAPPDRSTRTAAPATVPPAARTASIVS